ncbi:MAG: di-heme enzyme, partial [Rhodothermales bacterium]
MLSGIVVLWMLTQLSSTPFALSPEPLDWETLVSKAAEAGAFLLLIEQRSTDGRRHAGAGFVFATLGGIAIWQGGLLAAGMFPVLAHQDDTGHTHAPGTPVVHEHGDAEGGVTLKQWLSQTLPGSQKTAYDWNLPAGFPPPRVPEDNPMTEAKVELGRYLFYDPRLSGNGTQSCSSCHLQAMAFTDGLPQAVGSTGAIHPRSSMSLTNVTYNATLTWANSALVELEKQILVPIFSENPVELGVAGHEAEVLGRLRGDERYQRLFREAFPDSNDPFTINSVTRSLASFVRALVSGNSPYDRFVYGKELSALSESALRGMELALSEDLECHHCHGGFNFTTSTIHANTRFYEAPFHNTGLYNVDGEGSYPADNLGLFDVTNRPEDMGRFRAPTLRNIALTAPYMHDGSIATLEDVIRFYEQGGRRIEAGARAGDGRVNPYKSGFVGGFTLDDQQREDLIAFLHSLTDSTF